ncbi:hypothetical protein G5I_09396 [Acromyrmex echinatior]|uniref:Uncharacterized protein n=1 Tax=Acromyrmex echinatior TaxID=103372 RepID=F4WU41_ACREC|nr:hypothetical protein G5I_09396 [Acromyrmex echinatior]
MAGVKGGEEGEEGMGDRALLLADIYGLQQPLSGAAVRIGAGYSVDSLLVRDKRKGPRARESNLRPCEKTATKMAAECLGFPPCGTDGEPVIGKKHAIVAKHA